MSPSSDHGSPWKFSRTETIVRVAGTGLVILMAAIWLWLTPRIPTGSQELASLRKFTASGITHVRVDGVTIEIDASLFDQLRDGLRPHFPHHSHPDRLQHVVLTSSSGRTFKFDIGLDSARRDEAMLQIPHSHTTFAECDLDLYHEFARRHSRALAVLSGAAAPAP